MVKAVPGGINGTNVAADAWCECAPMLHASGQFNRLALICNCRALLAQDEFTLRRVSSKRQSDGKLVAMPMERIWPVTSGNEIEEVLTINAHNR